MTGAGAVPMADPSNDPPPVAGHGSGPRGPRGSLIAAFTDVVALHSDRIAVEADGAQVTYAELNVRIEHIAAALASLGPFPQRPIALLLDPGVDAVASILGVLRIGGAYVPLDPADPFSRLELIVGDSRVGAILTRSPHLELAQRLAGGRCPIVEAPGTSAAPERCRELPMPPPDALAFVMYTSGSTGSPKGVLQTHRNLLHYVRQYSGFLRVDPSDRLSMLYSLSFSASSMDIYGALLNGAALCMFDVRRHGLARLAAWIDDRRVTVLHAVPTVFRHLLERRPAGSRFASVRVIDLGGEPLVARDRELCRAHFVPGCRLVNHLAATEISVIAQHEVGDNDDDRASLVPVGRAAPGVHVRVVREDGTAADPDEAGEIVVHSPFLSPGYWQQPAVTASVFADDPDRPTWRIYRSGDLGRLTRGGLLIALGRKDGVVKIRGHSVHVAEVEAALRRIPGVEDGAVVAAAGGSGSAAATRLVAYAVFASAALDGAALRRELLRMVPRYACPAELHVVEALPRTSSGKIDHRALETAARAGCGARPAEPVSDPPLDALEREVSAIYARLLRVRDVGRCDDFFDLGGDSLSFTELQVELESGVHCELIAEALLRNPTVAGVAALIRRRLASPQVPNAPASLLVPLRTGGARRALFLVHGGHGRVGASPHLLEAVGPEQPLYGFRARGFDGLAAPHRDIAAMAAEYVALMRGAQPEGPYFIGAVCAGALVAHEMAVQLQAQGCGLAALLLIDPPTPPCDRVWPKRLARVVALGVARVLVRFAVSRRLLGSLLARLVGLGGWNRAHEMQVWLQFRVAAYRHRPRSYDGPAYVIGSRRRLVDLHARGWRKYLTGKLETVEVASEHLDVFDAANDQALRELRRSVDAAQEWLGNESALRRDVWQALWSREGFSPPWLGRGISKEIAAAVEDGWFPAGADALDVGCGEGDVTGWLAVHGFRALGVDIAPAAIARARLRHPESPGRLEFQVLDVCAAPPPVRPYRVIVDRGCFHQLTPAEAAGYAATLGQVSADDARLMLFVKAFRTGPPVGDPEERAAVVRRVEAALGATFETLRVAETYLDPQGGADPGHALPGLVFWMTRRPPRLL